MVRPFIALTEAYDVSRLCDWCDNPSIASGSAAGFSRSHVSTVADTCFGASSRNGQYLFGNHSGVVVKG